MQPNLLTQPHEFSSTIAKFSKEQNGLSTGPPGAEILKAIIESEQVGKLTDLFLRRTDMGWDLDRGQAKLESVANIMAEILGWEDARLQEQLRSYIRYIEERFPSHHFEIDSTSGS